MSTTTRAVLIASAAPPARGHQVFPGLGREAAGSGRPPTWATSPAARGTSARGARPGDLTDGLGGPCPRGVIGGVAGQLGAGDGIGERRDLPPDPGEHALLVTTERARERPRRLIPDRRRQLLDRDVGGDLQRLGGGRVLRVLEHLLLAAGSTE